MSRVKKIKKLSLLRKECKWNLYFSSSPFFSSPFFSSLFLSSPFLSLTNFASFISPNYTIAFPKLHRYVIKELIHTEQDYVKDLEAVVQVSHPTLLSGLSHLEPI